MSSNNKNLAIIIPALNEELSIGDTLADIPLKDVTVVVVDNGSEDDTAGIARNAGAIVVHEHRRGYGYACLAGIDYLKSMEPRPDLVIFLDADGADDPNGIIDLLSAKNNPPYPDIVMGSRLDRLEKGAMSKHALLANKVFTKLINLIYRVELTDMGPFRVMDFDTLLDIDMQDTGYGWTSEMIVKAIKKNYILAEVPVIYRPRLGESKISGSIIVSLKAAIWITIHILRNVVRG